MRNLFLYSTFAIVAALVAGVSQADALSRCQLGTYLGRDGRCYYRAVNPAPRYGYQGGVTSGVRTRVIGTSVSAPIAQTVEHPFANVPMSQQYRCRPNAAGVLVRVTGGDHGTGWCHN
jgi:hypothetical protein